MRIGFLLIMLVLLSTPPETSAQAIIHQRQQVAGFGVGQYGPSSVANRMRLQRNRLQQHRLRNITPGQTLSTRKQVLQRNRNQRNISRAGKVRLREINRPATALRSERQRREQSNGLRVRKRYLASYDDLRPRAIRVRPIVTSH